MNTVKQKISLALTLLFTVVFTMAAGWPPNEIKTAQNQLHQSAKAMTSQPIKEDERSFVNKLEKIANQTRFIRRDENNQWRVSQWTSWREVAENINNLEIDLTDFEDYIVQSFEEDQSQLANFQQVANQQAESLILSRLDQFEDLLANLRSATAGNKQSEVKIALIDLAEFFTDKSTSEQFLPIETPNPEHRDASQTVREAFSHITEMNEWLAEIEPLSLPGLTLNPTPEDLAESTEVQLTPAIVAKAVELENSPVNIYNWVKSNITYLPTFGSIQNSDQVLKNKQGNAFDTSALLIALLRAAQIPARYRYGKIQIESDKLINWLQVDTVENAINLLSQGGIPLTVLMAGGQIHAVEVEHVWVETWVDYFPSRGQINREGDSWVSLDASFKQHRFIPAIDLSQYGDFDEQQLIDDLNASATQGPFGSMTRVDVELFRDQMNSYIDQVQPAFEADHPDATLAEMTNRYEIIATDLPVLPSSLENKIALSAETYSALPEGLMHHLNLKMYASARDISYDLPQITHNIPLPELGLNTLSINYQPATASDQQVIDQHLANNDQSLRPYLINVKPQIQINGVTQVEAGAKSMGEIEYWTAGITDPLNLNSSPGEPYQWTTGSQVVLTVDGAGISPDALTAHNASQVNFGGGHVRNALHQAGLNYFAGHDLFDYLYAQKVGGRAVRMPSVGAFYAPLTVRYMFGVPRTGFMSSYQTDIKRITTSVVAPDQEMIKAFALQSGSTGSALEGMVWEMLFNKQLGSSTVSSVAIIHQANQKGIPIHTITQANLNDVMPLLELSADAEQEIFNAVSAGYEVTTPQQEISLGINYEGAGYIIRNPYTGVALYRLEGGTNGAALVGCIIRTIFLNVVFNTLLDQVWKMLARTVALVFGAAVIFGPAGMLLGAVAAFASNLYFMIAFGHAVLQFMEMLSTLSLDEIIAEYGLAAAVAAACSFVTPCMLNGLGGNKGDNKNNGKNKKCKKLLCKITNLFGNPTDVITGAKHQYFTDYESATPFGLEFTRLYFSVSQFDTLLGANWRHTYDRKIIIGESNNHAWPDAVLVVRADGSWYQFDRQSDNSLSPRSDISIRARALGAISSVPTGFEIINDHDEIETYNNEGLLVSIKNHSGLEQTLSYNAESQLETVTDHFGRSLQFTYDVQTGLLDKVTDPDGKVFDYDHDEQGNLIKVTYPDSTLVGYHYEDRNFPDLLTGITNEHGVRYATFEYNIDQQVTDSYWIGDLNHYQFEYGNNSTTVTDPLGKARTYYYEYINEQNRITLVDESCGSCGGGGNSQQIWNADGSLYQEIDFNGNITEHHYNDRGLETELIEAKGTVLERKTTISWHPDFDTATQIIQPAASSGQQVTTFTHYPNGKVHTKTITADGESRTWTYTYNAVGQMLTEDGPRTDVNDITIWTYDAQGNLRTETNALGHLIQWDDYNAHGQAQTMTDENGIVTTYVFDELTRLTTSTTDGEVTTYEYTDSGQLEKLILSDGSFLLYGYDQADRLESITDNLGNQLKYTLDNMGNRTLEETFDVSNTLVQKVTNVYNELGRLEQSIGADNQITRWTYDDQGNEKTHTDPLLQLTSSDYDALNRLEQITDPDLNTIGYSYDAQDNLRTVTDPRGLVTTYGYNGFNEQTKLTSPDTGITDYDYDEAGNLTTKTDARGQTATYVYDALNRLDSLTYSDEVIDFTYDQGTNGIGRLTQVTDHSGATAYTYDIEGRVDTKTQTTNGQNLISDYDYNALGQLEKLTTPSGAEITYSYRADGRVVSISVNGVEISRSIEYYPFGEPKSWEYGSGFTYQRNFDTDGRVDDYTQGADIQDIGYDAASRIDSLVDANASWGFTYDKLDRLKTANNTSISLEWDYDPTGNRLFEKLNGVQTDYDTDPNSNQLAQLGGQIRLYDDAGNLIDDGSITSTYSGRNRLISTQGALAPTTYRYNAFGERVYKQGQSTSLFTFDEEGHLLGEYDASGNLMTEVIWLDDTPIATIKPNAETHDGLVAGSFKVFFIHPDHLDTPRIIVDANNQVIWQWHSDPFGTQLANQDPDTDASDFEFNHRFPGQYFDVETGTHYNYFRDYEPGTGRYVQSDPIGLYGGINTYSYVGGEPLEYSDIEGLSKAGKHTGKGKIQGNCSIRKILYPTRPRKGTITELGAPEKCRVCGEKFNGKDKKPTFAHEPELVKYHNTTGYNTNQSNRNDAFNNLIVGYDCLQCQLQQGGSTKDKYRRDTGPSFEPRGKKR